MTDNANSVNIAPGKAGYHHGNLREALVAAGLAQLESRGVDGLSLREIARTVGVSATAVYRHFPDKAALMAALAMAGIIELGDRQARATAAVGGGRAGFIASGLAYIRFAVERPALFRLAFSLPPRISQLDAPPDQTAPAMQALRRDVLELFPRAATDPAHARRAALHAWAVVHGLAQLILDRQIPWDEDEVRLLLEDMGR